MRGLTTWQALIEETEGILEKWKHPDPYRPPTAPGGSKYERNLAPPNTDRMYTLKNALQVWSSILTRSSTAAHAPVNDKAEMGRR